jgi:hypothetical protein
MARIDTGLLLSAVIALFLVYQQYQIYQLSSEIGILKHQNDQNNNIVDSESKQTSFRPKQPLLESKTLLKKMMASPPPIIPKFENPSKNDKRIVGKSYGGAGDEVHLGGFTERDNNTISYGFWDYMLGPLAMKSVIDIGCGRGRTNNACYRGIFANSRLAMTGISTKYFKDNGAKVLCVEGSHDALKHSYLAKNDIIQVIIAFSRFQLMLLTSFIP